MPAELEHGSQMAVGTGSWSGRPNPARAGRRAETGGIDWSAHRRPTIIFDRGGWSPALFALLDAAGFDIATYRKYKVTPEPRNRFTEHQLVDDLGRTQTYLLADRNVRLPSPTTNQTPVRLPSDRPPRPHIRASNPDHHHTHRPRPRPTRIRHVLPLATRELLSLHASPLRARSARHLHHHRRQPGTDRPQPGQKGGSETGSTGKEGTRRSRSHRRPRTPQPRPDPSR